MDSNFCLLNIGDNNRNYFPWKHFSFNFCSDYWIYDRLNMKKKEFLKYQGKTLRTKRLMYGISQKQFAKAMKRSPATICLIETGKHGMSTYFEYKINQFFYNLNYEKNHVRNPN